MADDEFEWDDAKAADNLRKHGIAFDQARSAFADPFAVEDVEIVEGGAHPHDRAGRWPDTVCRVRRPRRPAPHHFGAPRHEART